MSTKESDKWNKDNRQRDLEVSPSCSSFEVLDAHDPVISRMATNMFKYTNDYLQGEMSMGQDFYTLLEDINRLTITKYTDLQSLAVNLSKSITEYNEMYQELIKPLLNQIDLLEVQMGTMEANAYRIDRYTKSLVAQFKQLGEK